MHAETHAGRRRFERLEKLVAAFKQAAFGRRSEKTDPDQFDLALEDLETAMAAIHAEEEADTPAGNRATKPRAPIAALFLSIFPCGRGDRAGKPDLRMRRLPASHRRGCLRAACCGPAQLRVIVTRRPKYACCACTDGVVQAPAPKE